jgi:aspartate/methionine/tyrosine aminotransferase
MHTITLRELVVSFGTVFQDLLSSKSVVIVSGTAAKLEPAKDYKRLTLFPDNERIKL